MGDAEPGSVEAIEEQARQKASAAMSKIEAAVVAYDSLSEKPPELRERIDYLRHAYGLLSSWVRSSLTGSKDRRSALVRLARFADICVKLDLEGAG